MLCVSVNTDHAGMVCNSVHVVVVVLVHGDVAVDADVGADTDAAADSDSMALLRSLCAAIFAPVFRLYNHKKVGGHISL